MTREEVLKNVDHVYDLVANDYWKTDKELLKDILLEAIWLGIYNLGEKQFGAELKELLKSRWDC